MNAYQLQSFTITRHGDGIVTEVRRNAFSTRGDSDAFLYQQRDCRGEVLELFSISLGMADFSLQKAIQLQAIRPDLISVETIKLSTGTSFNYPIPHI